MSKETLDADEVDRLSIALEEAARPADIKNPRFIEPTRGILDRAKSRRHHLVFGRRGSGKTSLLAKAAADLTVDRRPISFVDLESFKGNSYPDVLISVLIRALGEYKKWYETAAVNRSDKVSFWDRLFGSRPTAPPVKRAVAQAMAEKIEAHLGQLNELLHTQEEVELDERVVARLSKNTAHEDGLSLGPQAVQISAKTGYGSSVGEESEVLIKSKARKIDYLHRRTIEYQNLMDDIAQSSDGPAYLFLDDLYHIRRSDQADVIDFFHRILKGRNVWLKIGSIKHRTTWYIHSAHKPPRGLKIGDDADEIDLDLNLEQYSTTKAFLSQIVQNIADELEFGPVDRILSGGAPDRLVIASGGVARDFLTLFRRSIEYARERISRKHNGGSRGYNLGVEDVNQAAGAYDSAKRDELIRDTLEEREQIEEAFEKVRKFCIDIADSNCFLVEKDRNEQDYRLIEELADLRLIHVIFARETVGERPGKLYKAYMLDISQYAGERKRRSIKMFEFWKPAEKASLRRVRYIYDPTDPDKKVVKRKMKPLDSGGGAASAGRGPESNQTSLF